MIVIDACAIYEIVSQSDEGKSLQQLMLINEKAISCELVRAEVASILRKLVRTRKIDIKTAERYLENGLDLIDEFFPLEPLQTEVLTESIRLDHSSYDLFYFVLARRMGATLFTTDRKLIGLCEKHGVDTISLIDL